MIVIIKHTCEEGESIKNFNEILDQSNATLLDGSMLPSLARVQVDVQCVGELKSGLGSSWEVFPELTYPVPDTRKKLSTTTPRLATKKPRTNR